MIEERTVDLYIINNNPVFDEYIAFAQELEELYYRDFVNTITRIEFIITVIAGFGNLQERYLNYPTLRYTIEFIALLKRIEEKTLYNIKWEDYTDKFQGTSIEQHRWVGRTVELLIQISKTININYNYLLQHSSETIICGESYL